MSKFFKFQAYHLLMYVAVGGLLYFASIRLPEGQNPAWGWSASGLILVSWFFAGAFQFWILFFWRMELHFGRISARMGERGFLVFRIGFLLLGFCRFVLLIPISQSTPQTLSLSPAVSGGIIVVTTPLILWALYSVFFYFGLTRTVGADHFDPAYRHKGLEKRGVFKYIPNSMYTVAFLLAYHPGLFWRSRLGLIAALAHHALVWTHYFCTEKPDMKTIYGPAGN